MQGLYKAFGRHQALAGVDLRVPQGQVLGLLGPNGAGKTTLIRILAGIYAPDQGTVQIHRSPFTLGYLPEERGLYPKMRVEEQLLFLAGIRGLSSERARNGVTTWLSHMGLAAWRKHRVEQLSKGMQQKVQFIASVIHEPDLLILDEPFSGFDPINAEIIKQEVLRLKAQGTTIIFSTHRMESVEELCDQIALIHRARVLLQGSRAEIREQFSGQSYFWNCGAMPIGSRLLSCSRRGNPMLLLIKR
ncbi:MAG: ATP-binding cassette domain-containing protein [Cytophagales bacterium]|nr:ATP-binding cassette domain-containing protein [Cytophagales bacterium]